MRLPSGEQIFHRRVLRGASRREAVREEARVREAIRTGTYRSSGELPAPVDRPVGTKPSPTVKDFWGEFLAVSEAKNRPSEVHNKKKAGAKFLPLFGSWKLDQVGCRELERFKASLYTDGLKAKTVCNYVHSITRMLKLAKRFRLISEVPAVESISVPLPSFRFFSAVETDRLIAAADPQWRCIILTACRTGMRIGELLALSWENVDFARARVQVKHSAYLGTIQSTKTGKERSIPLGDDVLAALKEHRRHRTGKFVFGTVSGELQTDRGTRRPLERACRKAGLSKIGWHVLRHSFASQLVMAGAPLKAVSDLLGHTTIQMTMRYAHLSPAAMTDAVKLLDRSKQPRPA